MKALSIQQPWAWLIVNGYKDVENRDWNTKFRGRFYVHGMQMRSASVNSPHSLLPPAHRPRRRARRGRRGDERH